MIVAMNGEDAGIRRQGAVAPMIPLDFAELDGRTPPARKWAWEGYIPADTVTLAHGYGGTGKTLLGQQISAAYAVRRALFGHEMQGGPALMLAGEDDHDELWRRQVSICEAWGMTLSDFAEVLEIVPLAGDDITLVRGNEAGEFEITGMLEMLWQRIEDLQPGLVVLDNAAKIIAAPENNRISVTRALGFLHAICRDFSTTVLLLAHDNKTGEYSGSTSWENSVRSRLHLKRSEEDTEIVELIRAKSNYARPGEGTLKLRWDAGCFRCEDETIMTQAERVEAELRVREHAETFLRALDRLRNMGRNVSHSANAKNYAPKVIIDTNLNEGLSGRDLMDAMELCFREDRIVANAKFGRSGKHRNQMTGIARTEWEVGP